MQFVIKLADRDDKKTYIQGSWSGGSVWGNSPNRLSAKRYKSEQSAARECARMNRQLGERFTFTVEKS